MLFRQITVCLDMRGCPNRCRHCWLGVTPNGHLEEPDLRFVAQAFRPFTRDLEVMDWYREPDYGDDYQKMWELTGALSDRKTPHFENLSIWRAVRDSNYIPWLRSLGVRSAQLTLFGGEETTDLFFGRKGVYREILETIDRLLENGIAPRIQTFIYKQNIGELPHIEKLIDELDLKTAVPPAGGSSRFFCIRVPAMARTNNSTTIGSRRRTSARSRRGSRGGRCGIMEGPRSKRCWVNRKESWSRSCFSTIPPKIWSRIPPSFMWTGSSTFTRITKPRRNRTGWET